MDHSPHKSANRSVWMPVAASLAIGLCLLVGQGFPKSSSAASFLAANFERRFANSSPSQSAVASLEKQIRTQSKTPRRQLVFGVLPPNGALDMPVVCGERSLAESLCQASMTRALPNDRAPPPLTT
jgi:hypothetical protein